MRSGRRRRSRGLTPRRLVRAAVAAVAVLLLGWGAVRVDVLGATGNNPLIGARVAPSDPRVRISAAMLSFFLRGGAVPPAEQRQALDALRRAPLADEPFLIAAVDALAHGREADGERLLVEARRRNPRLRMARLLLLDRYLKQGRIREAAIEIGAIDRLVAGSESVLTPFLAKMVEDPKTGPQMIPMLRRQPVLQDRVLASLASGDASPALILATAGDRIRPSANPPEWQKTLLSRLVTAQRFGEALALWRRLSGSAGPAGEKGLYDAELRGLPGPPPFNWDLAAGGPGVSERTNAGTLSAEYYGRDDGDLASQLLMLRPGRYRFTFRAEGNADGASSRFVWTMLCGTEPIVQVPVAGVDTSGKSFAASFVVPQNCPAQWLRLRGVAGDMQAAQSATFGRLALQPETGR